MVRNIEPDDPMLQYSGRIDDDDPKAPVLIYAASWVKMIFTGTSVAVTLANHHAYWTNEMGYLLDGVQGRIRLLNDGKKKTYEIAGQLPDARHELMLFKRMDACHTVTFYGFTVDDGADLLPPEPKPARRMEVFGDSVSCGEVSEAVDYVGKEDPVHDGQYSNLSLIHIWLHEHGYRVPEDISVVGYDNYLFPGLCDVAITTYEVDMKEMARQTVHTLIKKMAGEPYRQGICIVEGHMVTKDSVKARKNMG